MSMEDAWQSLKELAKEQGQAGNIPSQSQAEEIVRRVLRKEARDLSNPPQVAIDFLASEFVTLARDYFAKATKDRYG